MSWPGMPGIGTLLAVGSQCGLVEYQATGFSWGSMPAVVGWIAPELMIWRSLWPVVSW